MKIGDVRRMNQGNAAFGIQPGQGRLQQKDFAYARLAGHELNQRARRPALAGKLGIQRGKPRWNGAAA